jgi:riboflavin synthase
MFTGLIREIGTIQKIVPTTGGKEFTVQAPNIVAELHLGDSVAVNGVCITVTGSDKRGFQFNAAAETLTKTTLSKWKVGAKVNLERPLKLGDSLDGHWVLGHVDNMVKVISRKPQGSSILLTVELPDELLPLVVLRGSIALDGVSLTIARLDGKHATISLVPHTLKNTTLADRRVGDFLNAETDILGKHVVQYIKSRENDSKVTKELLKNQGFI